MVKPLKENYRWLAGGWGVGVEVCRFVGLIPLAFIDLRLSCDPMVSVSDASSSGGELHGRL